MNKIIALLRAFWHWIFCGGDTIINDRFRYGKLVGKSIYCDKCGKIFYEK